MPHRFTEPTPTSQAGVRTVEVFVASWEIECCAPPPEVGSLSTWTLEFVSADQYPCPDLDHESIWWATPWPPDTAPLVATQLSDGPVTACLATQLSDGPVTACWSRIDVEVGAIGLRGRLSGTVHVVPGGFPRTTGRVNRLQAVTQQYIWVATEWCWKPVPSTSTLTDIQHSPRWFTDYRPASPVDGDTRVSQTGVLLDLVVPDAPGQNRRVPTHIALLRGINLGGHNRVAMAELRAVVTSLDHTDVATYIQSGNVVFTSTETDTTAIAAALERAIAAELSVAPRVVVLSREELAQVVADNPYPQEMNPRCLHAAFTAEPIGDDQLAAIATAQQRARDKGSPDEATVVGRALFLHTPGGLGRSELAAQLARTAGPLAATGSATVRNWATVTKLLAMCQPRKDRV